MAKLTMSERKALPKSAFGVPSKAPGPGSYPMPDKAHAANAKARAAGKPVEDRVDAKADKKLGIKEGSARDTRMDTKRGRGK